VLVIFARACLGPESATGLGDALAAGALLEDASGGAGAAGAVVAGGAVAAGGGDFSPQPSAHGKLATEAQHATETTILTVLFMLFVAPAGSSHARQRRGPSTPLGRRASYRAGDAPEGFV
jgi:hypothetical protein